MTDEQPSTEGIDYADAIAELEAILGQLESDDLDVDALAGRVARAAELITLCRDRITKARLEVERVVGDLQ
jgi:exodeoxyribonuclease VII small subunit